MKQETKKPNKFRFWIGILIVLITVILMLTGEEELEEPCPFLPLRYMLSGLL